jgi:hypothetical protein
MGCIIKVTQFLNLPDLQVRHSLVYMASPIPIVILDTRAYTLHPRLILDDRAGGFPIIFRNDACISFMSSMLRQYSQGLLYVLSWKTFCFLLWHFLFALGVGGSVIRNIPFEFAFGDKAFW